MGKAALSHIRVLDLSRVLAGPWAGQNLADLGAEVIKIERPRAGDDTRAWGPPFLKNRTGDDTGESAYYLSTNRGKKSVTVDITRTEGQDLVRQLVSESDIVLENFKVGGLKKYGLDYDSLKALNPGLIYCSITGFGQTGPLAERPGYDAMIQAMGGLMSITGERDDQPGGGPQKVGVAMADILTGMYATVAVLAALASRDWTGKGQQIDLALLDVQTACLANQAMNYLVSDTAPGRLGTAHPNIVPYQAFATADGYMILAVGNDHQFARFCELAGQAGLAEDTRFGRNADRVRNRDDLIPIVEQILRRRSTAEWLQVLEPASIPCGPINTIDEVFAEPQVKHRGMRIEMDHARAGKIPLVASPMKLSGTPVEYQRPPPLLGEHTEEVLGEVLGLTSADFQALRADGVL
jgi:crotonobetainyl-CoA:carnitine CoA-transferase CaiB-like acyl-CoA transferase